jgi:hypothetical protein
MKQNVPNVKNPNAVTSPYKATAVPNDHAMTWWNRDMVGFYIYQGKKER